MKKLFAILLSLCLLLSLVACHQAEEIPPPSEEETQSGAPLGEEQLPPSVDGEGDEATPSVTPHTHNFFEETCSCGETKGEEIPPSLEEETQSGAPLSEEQLPPSVDGEGDEATPSVTPHTHNFFEATCQAPATCSCGETKGEALACAVVETREGLIAKTCRWCGEKLNVIGSWYEEEYGEEGEGVYADAEYEKGDGVWQVFYSADRFDKYIEFYDIERVIGTNVDTTYKDKDFDGGRYRTLELITTRTSMYGNCVRLFFYEVDGVLCAVDTYQGEYPEESYTALINADDLLCSDGAYYETYREALTSENGITIVTYLQQLGYSEYKIVLTLRLITAGSKADEIEPIVSFTYEYGTRVAFHKSEAHENDVLIYDEEGNYYTVVANYLNAFEKSRSELSCRYDTETGILTVVTSEWWGEPIEEATVYFRLYSDMTCDMVDSPDEVPLAPKEPYADEPWGIFFGINEYTYSPLYGFIFYENSVLEAEMSTYDYRLLCVGEAGDIAHTVIFYPFPGLDPEIEARLLAMRSFIETDGFDFSVTVWADNEGTTNSDVEGSASLVWNESGATLTVTGGEYAGTVTIPTDRLYMYIGTHTSGGRLVGYILAFATQDPSMCPYIEVEFNVEEDGTLTPDVIKYNFESPSE